MCYVHGLPSSKKSFLFKHAIVVVLRNFSAIKLTST